MEVSAVEKPNKNRSLLVFTIIVTLIALILSFIETFDRIIGLEKFDSAVLAKHPGATSELIAEAIGASLLVPLILISIFSLFKNSRNATTRCYIFISWSIFFIVLYLPALVSKTPSTFANNSTITSQLETHGDSVLATNTKTEVANNKEQPPSFSQDNSAKDYKDLYQCAGLANHINGINKKLGQEATQSKEVMKNYFVIVKFKGNTMDANLTSSIHKNTKNQVKSLVFARYDSLPTYNQNGLATIRAINFEIYTSQKCNVRYADEIAEIQRQNGQTVDKQLLSDSALNIVP